MASAANQALQPIAYSLHSQAPAELQRWALKIYFRDARGNQI